MIQIKYDESIKDQYYDLISTSRSHSFKNFEKYYQANWQNTLGYELRDILCGDFEKLLEIKDALTPQYNNSKALKELFNYDKPKTTTITPLISKLQPKIAEFIEENIEIHTCYFCNIDFINVFKSKKKGSKNGFTLDHLIDKATYPFLALSLFNLIPSCYICNSKLKRDEPLWSNDADMIKLSPSSNQFNFNEKVKFRTFFSGPSLQIKSKKDFDVFLKEDGAADYEKYIDVFMLDERYAYHKQHILEMIEKRRVYPDSRIEELAKLTKQTTAKVKQDLFGTVLYEDDLSKRSLSKFTKDIAKEMGLL